MNATTSNMNGFHLFTILQLITTVVYGCLSGQLQRDNGKCCEPILHCPPDHFVEPCNRMGRSRDKCVPCSSDMVNPFITSSFDIKKCYRSSACSTDAFPGPNNKCYCALHKGYYGNDPRFCQFSYERCLAGQELTIEGKCEQCENNHYKDWPGLGYCIKEPDCSKLSLASIPGNVTTPTKCLHPTLPQITPKRLPQPTTKTTTAPSPLPRHPTTKTGRTVATEQPGRLPDNLLPPVPPTGETKPFTERISIGKTSTRSYIEPHGFPICQSCRDIRDLYIRQYIYMTVIGLLVILLIIQAVCLIRLNHKRNRASNKRKKTESNYQQIDYLREAPPPQIQRPLPRKPSLNNLIDTYMEMGKTNSMMRTVPCFINNPYAPSTMTRLLQQPGTETPLIHPIYQQNTQAMMNLLQCIPHQESNGSKEDLDDFDQSNSLVMPDFSLSSETALKVTDIDETGRVEPNRVEPNRVEPARVEPARVEPARVEPVRVEPFRGEFRHIDQDTISMHTTSDYGPPVHLIQPTQATQMGIVYPQFLQYTLPLSRTRSRDYM